MHYHLIISMLLLVILNLVNPTIQTLLPRRILAENISLPSSTSLFHCRTKCGEFDLANFSTSGSFYPFGIGRGCFRPGFELICNDITDPPMLLLGDGTTKIIKFFGEGLSFDVIVDTSIHILHDGVDSYNASWESPGISFSVYSASFTTIGCGARTSLFDPKTNAEIGSCITSCETEEKLVLDKDGQCVGEGCCTIDMSDGTKEFLFKITRDEKKNKSDMHNVKAFLHSPNYNIDNFQISQADLLSNSTVGGSHDIPMLSLRWRITDRPTCKEAAQDMITYACVSNYSECYDDGESNGYTCGCSGFYNDGNPYIVHGCQKNYPYNRIRPNTHCSRKCGRIDVPFPFGLEEGCYGRESFRLNCIGSKLLLHDSSPVAEVLLDEGLLRVEVPQESFEDVFPWTGDMVYGSSSLWINLSWFIDNVTCPEAKKNGSLYACVSDHSECLDINNSTYRCKCSVGFQGNPYVLDGCTDINECLLAVPVCNGTCRNTIGSFKCIGTKGGQIHLILGIIIGFSGGIATLLFVMCTKLLIGRLKREKQKKIRKKYFNKNQGMLLQQLIPSAEEVAKTIKIFSLEELEIATNNFDRVRILGQGGHGTIYKGILLDHGVVAIKKAKLVKETEIRQFINEVAILSQIIHKNVVKFIGCCLETEVPLLVYEFISKGTLYDKLHKFPGNLCSLIWEDRLRIAIEIAGALSYLHSAASISIFHRDVKSSNILLDDNYTAKVSDFGASRCVPMNQKEVRTAVQGTFGYLDPQYHHTGQLTEKSDVYSFGVIIVELLTRKQPIFTDDLGESTYLSHYFRQAFIDESYTEIIDVHIQEEFTEQEMAAMIDLVEMCLKLRGEERPTMKEVEMRLQFIFSNRKKQE